MVDHYFTSKCKISVSTEYLILYGTKSILSILIVLKMLTAILGQLPTIDLVLNHISPIKGALADMEVQGNGVSQARYQHTELSFIQINAADLVAV